MTTTPAPLKNDDTIVTHDECVIPWECIAPFLCFSDMLSLRLTSSTVANVLLQMIGPKDCARWLREILLQRNLYVMKSTQQWRDATHNDVSILQACLLPIQTTLQDTITGTTTINTTSLPLDTLLRYMRCFHYMPSQAAIAYNGEYGRFCFPLSEDIESDTKVISYDACHRGKKHCNTCQLDVPIIPNDDDDSDSSDSNQNEQTHPTDDTSGNEQSTDNSSDGDVRAPAIVHDIANCFVIATAHGDLDLNQYIPKCIPNLPSTLVCPVCRETRRRTLMLIVGVYRTRPECADGRHWRMPLTFVPLEDSDPKHRRRRKNGHQDKRQKYMTTYPPMYREVAIPALMDTSDGYPRLLPSDVDDYRTFLSMHCAECERFGVIAPTMICPGLQQHKSQDNDHYYCQCIDADQNWSYAGARCVVGGVVRRTQCFRDGCLRGMLCSECYPRTLTGGVRRLGWYCQEHHETAMAERLDILPNRSRTLS
jgi:hypothetical protein